MPRFNQTGPMGQGSMTGHRMGMCTSLNENPENQVSTITESSDTTIPENTKGRILGFGRGRGGRGFGMGRQNRFRLGTNR